MKLFSIQSNLSISLHQALQILKHFASSCDPVLKHFVPSFSDPVLKHFASSFSDPVLKHFAPRSGSNFEAFRPFNKRSSIEAFRFIKRFIKRFEFEAFRLTSSDSSNLKHFASYLASKSFRYRSLIMPQKKNRRFEISLLQTPHSSSLIDRFRSFS